MACVNKVDFDLRAINFTGIVIGSNFEGYVNLLKNHRRRKGR